MQNQQDQVPSIQSSLIKINSASREELQVIRGIGPLLSARIIDYRSKVGAIRQKEQLHAIKGMRAHQIEQMASHVDWSENGVISQNKISSPNPAIILSGCFLIISLYLIYPMAELFFEEFTHWENNLLHWYTNTVNLLAILFTLSALALTLVWLLSLFYLESPKLTKAIRLTLVCTASSFGLLLVISTVGYFLFQARADVTAYMADLLVVVLAVLILVYLQYLPQLLFLSQLNRSPFLDRYYDYSLMPLSMGILLAGLDHEFESLPTDIFLLWIAFLLFLSSLSMIQRRSCFADLLQELSSWPNILQNQPVVALKLGHSIRIINEQRLASSVVAYLGWLTMIFSLAAISHNLIKVTTRLII